jgi:hypothetical protein
MLLQQKAEPLSDLQLCYAPTFATMSPTLRSFFLIVFSLSLVVSIAQSVELNGVLIDPSSQDPVVGAVVQLVGTGLGSTTNLSGQYLIKKIPQGNYTIRVSSLGFGTVETTLKLDRNLTKDFNMEVKGIDLREVNVRPQGQGTNTEVINGMDRLTRPVNSSQDLLQLVPGLFIAQHAGGGKAEQIFFRGFDVDHGTDLQVSVDGLPVNMVSHAHGQGYADLHFTIPETVDKLLVHKGPYDARFGDFATSGTVEFLTKNSLDKSEVKLEGGMFNTMRAVGQFDLLGKKHLLTQRTENAYIAGEYAYTDAYFKSPQGFGRYNLFGKYTGQLAERTHLTLSGSTFGAQWSASGQVPQRAVTNGIIDRFGSVDDQEGGSTERTNAYATLVSGLRNGGSIKNQVYFVKYDFELFSNFTFFANDSANGDMIAQTDDRSIMGYTGSYNVNTHLGSRALHIGTGVGLRYDQADIALKNAVERVVFDTIVAGSVDQLNANGYVDATLDVTDRFSVNLAARLDVFRFMYGDARGTDSLSGTAVQHRFSPKLNFSYVLSDRVQLYLRTGMGFHSNDARAVVVDQANRTLPRAYGVDIGSTFKPLPRMLVNAALFGLYLESELVYVGDGGVVETSDPTRRMGLDVSVRYQVTKKLFADMDVNLVQAQLVGAPSGEDQIPLAPRFTTIGGLAYVQERGWNASLRYRHIADRPANETNSVVAKGYFLIDAKTSYRFTALEIGASVENLLNAEWNQAQFDTESRLSNETAAVSELHFTPGTPFFLKGFVTYRF